MEKTLRSWSFGFFGLIFCFSADVERNFDFSTLRGGLFSPARRTQSPTARGAHRTAQAAGPMDHGPRGTCGSLDSPFCRVCAAYVFSERPILFLARSCFVPHSLRQRDLIFRGTDRLFDRQ